MSTEQEGLKQKEMEKIWARASRVRMIRPARLSYYFHSTRGKWIIPLENGSSREATITRIVDAIKASTFDGFKPMEGSDLMDRTRSHSFMLGK